MRFTRSAAVTGFAALALPCGTAMAGSHTWDVRELFSNADGTIQFIELMECCGGANETALNGHQVSSNSTGSVFTFTANLAAGTTANKSILLATQGYADLALIQGAPAPDHIIGDNFIDVDGDTLVYHVYDTFTFGSGVLPTDGLLSIQVTNHNTDAFVTATNAPKNCDGDTGSIDASAGDPCPWDCDGSDDGIVGVDDFLAVLAQWTMTGTSCDLGEGAPAVGVDEFLAILGHWGSCP